MTVKMKNANMSSAEMQKGRNAEMQKGENQEK